MRLSPEMRSNVFINNNCSIGSHTDIGHDGSGFESHESGVSGSMQHFGRVLADELSWVGTGSVLKECVFEGGTSAIGMSLCMVTDVDRDVTVARNPSRSIF